MRLLIPTSKQGEQPVLLHAAALAALLIAANPAIPLLAQGLDSEEAIDKIIDAPVVTEERGVGEQEGRISEAIAKSRANAREISKRFALDRLDIIFVPELAEENSPLSQTIEEHDEAIEELRVAIEGSALFYHAVDSHSVLLRDIVAVEFGSGNDVTIFAAGKNPEN
jgi:predicted amino acid-binding ACT domain protein